MKIAQCFSFGSETLKNITSRTDVLNRPFGTFLNSNHNPTLKGRAIVSDPSGIDNAYRRISRNNPAQYRFLGVQPILGLIENRFRIRLKRSSSISLPRFAGRQSITSASGFADP